MNYTTVFPINQVITYGFKKGGKYKIKVESRNMMNSVIVLLNKGYLKDSLQEICSEKKEILKNNNAILKNSNTTIELSGTIKKEGVYRLFIVECSQKQIYLNINGSFSNPGSLLDYRNQFLVPMFKLMAILYCCIFGYWFSQSPILRIFKYPLHTAFMLLPLIRSVSLYIWHKNWKILSKTEKTPPLIYYASHAFDVIFYTAYLSTLLFLCGGCNIYRIKFGILEHFDIILASFTITIGIVIIPIASNEKVLVLGFGLTIIGLVWYLSIGIIAMVKAEKIVSLVYAKPPLMKRIIKSRKTVSITYLLSFITLIIYILMYCASMPEFDCALVLEVGCFTCILIMFWFYTDDPAKTIIYSSSHSFYYPVTVNTPCGSEIVLLQKIKGKSRR